MPSPGTITVAQERELIEAAQRLLRRDPLDAEGLDARNRVCDANLGLSESFFGQGRKYGMEPCDVISVAWEGLVRAVQDFDLSRTFTDASGSTRKVQFSSFAWWKIKGAMSLEIRVNGFRTYYATRDPDHRLASYVLVGEPDPASDESDPEADAIAVADLLRILASWEGTRFHRHAEIIRARYGFAGRGVEPLKEIAARYGVTHECIRQQQVRGEVQLRKQYALGPGFAREEAEALAC